MNPGDPGWAWRSAREMAGSVRAGEIRAVELLELHLDRIRRFNPGLNALVTVDESGARQHALAADQALARGVVWGPLHGVPVTLKDSLETAGLRTTAGYEPLREHVPHQDASAVARLRAAGAILLGKTNLPPLAGDFITENPLFGRTNNPWDQTRTPGGSTGGGAAAVAAGLSPLELGSDLGGSLRLPAHFCGVYSLKPSHGRVPLTGHIPNPPGARRPGRHLWSIGPLARGIDDLELALRLIAGPDGQDWGVPPVPLDPAPTLNLRSLRIAWWTDFGVPLSAEIEQVVESLAGSLMQAGCRVDKAAPAGFSIAEAQEVWGALLEMEYTTGLTLEEEDAEKQRLERRLAQDPGRLAETPSLRGKLNAYRASVRQYMQTLERRDALLGALEGFLRDWDAWLCPVSSTPAFPHQKPGHPVLVDGQPVRYALVVGSHCLPFALTGSPVVTLPAGQTPTGLPVGVQLVGRLWGEAHLIAVAKCVADLTPGFQRPPGFD